MQLVEKKIWPAWLWWDSPEHHNHLFTSREKWQARDFRITIDWTTFGGKSHWPDDHDCWNWDDHVIGKVQLENMVAVGTEKEEGRKMNRRILRL
jgi:hypothetical protein